MANDMAILANGQKVDWGHVQSLQAAELAETQGIDRTLVVQPSHQRQALLPDPDLDRRIGEAAARIRERVATVGDETSSRQITGHGAIHMTRTANEDRGSNDWSEQDGSGAPHYGSLPTTVA